MLAMLANSIIQECQGSGVLPVMSRTVENLLGLFATTTTTTKLSLSCSLDRYFYLIDQG